MKCPCISLEYHPALCSALYNREALYNGAEGCLVGIAVGPDAQVYKLTEPNLQDAFAIANLDGVERKLKDLCKHASKLQLKRISEVCI